MSEFKAAYLATGIGSLPYRDPEESCRIILEHFPEIPFWPQLPRRGIKEDMCVQFTESLPYARLDEERKRAYFVAPSDTSELEAFYESYLNNDYESASISEQYASGLKAMLRLVENDRPEGLRYFKGQVVGPITFNLSIPDENGVSVFYNETLSDAATKGLAMKACWQVRLFRDLGLEPIIFYDEPYLASFGSAYMSVSREQIIEKLNEVIRPVREAGALVGVHCCGNTDWSMLFSTEADIINFDAAGFVDKLACYEQDVAEFLDRGGTLGWGIVPTVNFVGDETVESLVKSLEEGIDLLTSKGVDRDILLNRCLITPSCGMGMVPENNAEKILGLASGVSAAMKERYL